MIIKTTTIYELAYLYCRYEDYLCGQFPLKNDDVVERQKYFFRLELDNRYHGDLNVTIGVGDAVVFIEEDGM